MLISQVKQLTAVDGWIDFNGQIKECKEIKQRTKSQMSQNPGQQYNVQKLVIVDDTDSISGWAYADKQFLPGMRVSVHGQLKDYKGVKYFDYADVKTPQSSQNNAPQPAQSNNSTQQDNYDKFVIENRQIAGRCAAHAIQGIAFDNNMEIAVKILDIAQPLAEWFMTGKAPPLQLNNSFDQFAANNPAKQDDIPDY